MELTPAELAELQTIFKAECDEHLSALNGLLMSLEKRPDDTEALNETCGHIEQTSGTPVVGLSADLSNGNDAARVVHSGLERFGRIDILVTNAGGPPAGQFESLSRDQWEAAARLTLYSAIELTRQVLPGMKEHRWGRILNITSIAVKQPVDNLILSNSLRAAVSITRRWQSPPLVHV